MREKLKKVRLTTFKSTKTWLSFDFFFYFDRSCFLLFVTNPKCHVDLMTLLSAFIFLFNFSIVWETTIIINKLKDFLQCRSNLPQITLFFLFRHFFPSSLLYFSSWSVFKKDSSFFCLKSSYIFYSLSFLLLFFFEFHQVSSWSMRLCGFALNMTFVFFFCLLLLIDQACIISQPNDYIDKTFANVNAFFEYEFLM